MARRKRKVVRLVDSPDHRGLRDEFLAALAEHEETGPIRGFLVVSLHDPSHFKTTTNWPPSRSVELIGILSTIQHARNREVL